VKWLKPLTIKYLSAVRTNEDDDDFYKSNAVNDILLMNV